MLYAIFGGCNVYIGSVMNRDSKVVTANYIKRANIGEEKSVAETTKHKLAASYSLRNMLAGRSFRFFYSVQR